MGRKRCLLTMRWNRQRLTLLPGPAVMYKFMVILAAASFPIACWSGESEAESIARRLSAEYCGSVAFLECTELEEKACSALFKDAAGACDYSDVWLAVEDEDIDGARKSALQFAECVTRKASQASARTTSQWDRCMHERSSAIREAAVQNGR